MILEGQAGVEEVLDEMKDPEFKPSDEQLQFEEMAEKMADSENLSEFILCAKKKTHSL